MPDWPFSIYELFQILAWGVIAYFLGSVIAFFYIWWHSGNHDLAACVAFNIKCEECEKNGRHSYP